MCGICGVIQIGGEPREVINPATLDWMTDAMTHRGPNDRGTYAAPGVALGVRRLSVVDVEGGHQPFANESGEIWAIQNGEIYNHADAKERAGRERPLASAAAVTPRFSRTSTNGTAPRSRSTCGECSASPSGTVAGGPRSSPAIASASSPSTTRSAATSGVRLRAEEPPRQRPDRARARLRGDRDLSRLWIRAGPANAACRRPEAHSGTPARRRERCGHGRVLLALPGARADREASRSTTWRLSSSTSSRSRFGCA